MFKPIPLIPSNTWAFAMCRASAPTLLHLKEHGGFERHRQVRLTTQSPHEVWIAVDVKARKPVVDWPPMRIVRFSGRRRRMRSAFADPVSPHPPQ
jgi:hypothetical protein